MYYGSHKISEVTDTNDGYKLILFEQEENEQGEKVSVPPEITSERMLEACQTEEPGDASSLDEARMKVFKEDLSKILVMHNAYYDELIKALNAVNDFMNVTFQQADEVAWGEPSHRKCLHLCNKFLSTKE